MFTLAVYMFVPLLFVKIYRIGSNTYNHIKISKEITEF